jgi:hypothetical protein
VPRYAIQPKGAATLAADATPTSGTDLEALPWDLHAVDTTSFATATKGIVSVFYQTVNTDKTLGNMESAGQLPSPQWFEIAGYACDILAIPSAATTAASAIGALADIANILKTVYAAFFFTLSNKNYGTFPLTLAHCSGGEVGTGYGTFAAPTSIEQGNNGIPDGGWWIDGAIVIPSQQNFSLTIITTTGTATTLTQTPMPVRSNLWGVLHRRVL